MSTSTDDYKGRPYICCSYKGSTYINGAPPVPMGTGGALRFY